MSRLENKLTDRELYMIGEVFLNEFISSYICRNRLRKAWKHPQFIVRGDAHFCCHDFMDWNEHQFVESQEFVK